MSQKISTTETSARPQIAPKPFENDQQFQSIFEHAALGIATFSETGNWLTVNKKFSDILGYSKEELLTMTSRDITFHDDAKRELSYVQQMIAGKLQTYTLEKRCVRKDGTLLWINQNVSVVKNQDNSINYCIAVIEDIARRKSDQDAASIRNFKCESIIGNSPSCLSLKTMDGYYALANPTLQRVLHLPEDQVIGKTDFDLYPESVAQTFKANDDLVRQTLSRHSIEELVPVEGGFRNYMSYIFPVLDDFGAPRFICRISLDMTESKLAKLELHASEERMRQLIDHAPASMAIVNRDMCYLAVSQRWIDDYSITDKQLIIGKSHYDVFPEITEEWKAIHRRAMAGETLRSDEDKFVRADGSIQWLRWEVRPWYLQDKTIGGILIFSEEISRFKHIEESLRDSEQRFRATFEQAAVGLALVAPDGQWLRVNSKLCEIVGYSKDELLASSFQNITFIDDLHADMVYVQQMLAGEIQTYSLEKRYIRKGGDLIWINLTVALVRKTDGAPDYFISVVENVQARKLAKLDLDRYKAIIEFSDDAIISKTLAGIITSWNKGAEKIFGYSAEEAIGQSMLMLIPDDRLDEEARILESIAQSKTIEHFDTKRIRKNGQLFHASIAISPILDITGKPIGASKIARDITRNKRAEEEIQHLAFYDPLTKLPNRRLLQDRLRQVLAISDRSKQRCAILLIDLDHFKNINDSLGHLMGDMLLVQVAQRLKASLRESDSVARIGGDEFVVLVENLSEDPMDAASQVRVIGGKIVTQLNISFQLGEHKYHNTASIGVAMNNDQTLDFEMLFKQADIAMYQAKKAGRNALSFFDPKMQEHINYKTLLSNDLRNAIDMEQFQLHYQIQMNSAIQPTGVEALLRWQHPQRGLLSPDDFIVEAEECGLILPIGEWVLRTACIQLKAWEQQNATSQWTVAVNVSARQFHQVDFVAQIKNIVEDYSINPNLLKLELTESMLIENVQDVIRKMKSLKEIGIRFSLDDFGTGYSSLQYLKELPLDQLKIDQSFIRDISSDNGNNAIVATIIAMARGLRIKVIAEGVETEAQREFLESAGCTYFQGYLFGKPMPIDEIQRVIVQNFNS